MHIFPNSANKKKDLYPAYLKRTAQVEPGMDVTEEQEPVDDAFDAIKDLPMFGDESAPVDGAAPVTEVAVDGVPVAEVAPEVAPEGAATTPIAAVEKAQAAVEEAAVAISEAVESIAGGADTAVVDVDVEVEKPGKDEKKDECKDKKDEECKDEDKKDEKPDADDSKPDFLKKEGDPDKDEPKDKPKDNPFEKKDDGETKEAAISGGFMKMADLSPQVAKEVYEYWRALGMPEEFCKALTKKN